MGRKQLTLKETMMDESPIMSEEEQDSESRAAGWIIASDGARWAAINIRDGSELPWRKTKFEALADAQAATAK